MFLVGNASFFSNKEYRVFDQQWPLNNSGDCVGFVRGRFCCGGGGGAATVLQYLLWRRLGTVEDDELRDSEAVEKMRKTGDSNMQGEEGKGGK